MSMLGLSVGPNYYCRCPYCERGLPSSAQTPGRFRASGFTTCVASAQAPPIRSWAYSSRAATSTARRGLSGCPERGCERPCPGGRGLRARRGGDIRMTRSGPAPLPDLSRSLVLRRATAPIQVCPRSVPQCHRGKWRAWRDSNPRPTASEAGKVQLRQWFWVCVQLSESLSSAFATNQARSAAAPPWIELRHVSWASPALRQGVVA